MSLLILIWLVVSNFFPQLIWDSPSQLTFIFFRGVETTNQLLSVDSSIINIVLPRELMSPVAGHQYVPCSSERQLFLHCGANGCGTGAEERKRRTYLGKYGISISFNIISWPARKIISWPARKIMFWPARKSSWWKHISAQESCWVRVSVAQELALAVLLW